MNADGTCVTQLTAFSELFTKKKALRPAWSPDGTKILFELYSGQYSSIEEYFELYSDQYSSIDLYTVTADGNYVKRLTQDGKNCDAQWSPDGSKIAFKSDRDGKTLLYIMNADGSEKKQLTNISTLECRNRREAQEWNYDWSPDGRQIVFTGLEQGQQDVYIVDVEDDSELVNVTNHPTQDRAIAWWPGNDKILFQSDRLAEENKISSLLTLYIMDGNGANIQRVVDFAPISSSTPNEYYLRGWVPTTTLHLVLSNTYRPMYILDVACALENPSEPGLMPEGCYRVFDKPFLDSLDEPYWSSGDPKLTFRLRNFRGNIPLDDIIVANYDGTGATNLTGCSADDKDPAWSP